MENTIENAQDFFEAALEKWRDSPSLHFDHARCAFEYAASVRPDVVVPSEKEVKSDLIYHSYRAGLVAVWGFIALLFNPCTKAD